MSIFVTIEGIEGSGKSTLLDQLARSLLERNVPVVTTREPGGTELGKRIRELLLHGESQVGPTAEVLLFSADRAQHIDDVIRPALRRGAVVLCDRFVLSTLAYQGYGRGVSMTLLREVNRIATDGIVPDLTFVLDVPAELGLKRARARRGRTDRFEELDLEFHRAVRQGFLDLAQQEPSQILVLNGEEERASVASQALAEIERKYFETTNAS